MTHIPFDFPPITGYLDQPRWDGLQFTISGHTLPILEYSENFIGWSDDLTALHEESVSDNHPLDIASRKNAINQVKHFSVSQSSVIMEIGCSSGFLIKDLVKAFPSSLVIGVDVVKKPLYKLAVDLPGIPLIRFDLLRCPLPDKIIDVLIMLNVLEHINNDVSALENAFALLKPGGILIIEVPAGPFLYDKYDSELYHFRRYSAHQLKHKLIEVGFEVVMISHLGFVLYPAFVVIKLLNKWLPANRKVSVVRDQASKTQKNLLVKWAIDFESKYFANVSLPWGIRVLSVVRRPY